ncbi:hypothetical protein GCM10011342_13390 [Aquisalinus flavus]|uniref:Cadherin domain-containing protein n=1 Tax=Aquisalinus flavus TaxID=1526572 RepID=A0A8J2V1D8_9PROT|nr:hypothetical protein GCM10011342_13390 [Aquisalinus flavus]
MPENTTSVFTATATDADGDSLTYSIAGGADAALFAIGSSSGALSFAQAPDFENPTDANGDNVYDVIIAVSDGRGGSDSAALAVTVSDVSDLRYVDKIFPETTITQDIVYATTDGQDYVLNIITPVGDDETDRPVMLLASGGAFIFTIREQVRPFAEEFARRGYVAAIMDYRTLGRPPEGGNDFRLAALDSTHDMIAAVRFLRANAAEYGIDPEKVFVGGTSGGAVMAASVATTDPNDPAPVVLADYLETVGGVYGNIGDHLDQSPTVQGAFAISGAVFDLLTIDAQSAPIYAAHNELDPVANCYTFTLPDTDFTGSGSCDFIPFYQATGLPADAFIVIGDTEHVDFTNEEYNQILSEASQFFYDNVLSED